MSVQPTSEKRTVRQLAGSSAPWAALAVMPAAAAAAALAVMPTVAAAKTGNKSHAGIRSRHDDAHSRAVTDGLAASHGLAASRGRAGGTILSTMGLSADKRAPPHPEWP